MKRKYLLTPGPSPVPARVRESLSKEIIHHRTAGFRAILKEVHEGLREVMRTRNPVIVFAASGTGAMEASVSNFLSASDTIIYISGGKFGERWGEIAAAYGVQAVPMSIEWGSAPHPEQLTGLLKKHTKTKAVYATLCETSTATVYDIKALAQAVKGTDAIFVVDAISGLGQDELLTDEWGVDVVVSGSQKGLMLPPGIACISISEKAKAALKSSNLPKYYFDIAKALKSYDKDDTPYTPAVSLLRGMNVSLKMILEEGLSERITRFRRLAKATQAAAEAIGLTLFSKSPSASVTALHTPDTIPSSGLVKKLRTEYGLSIAGGQAKLKDKIIRIAHMGAITKDDLIVGFSLIETALKELGHSFTDGASLQKFQQVYTS